MNARKKRSRISPRLLFSLISRIQDPHSQLKSVLLSDANRQHALVHHNSYSKSPVSYLSISHQMTTIRCDPSTTHTSYTHLPSPSISAIPPPIYLPLLRIQTSAHLLIILHTTSLTSHQTITCPIIPIGRSKFERWNSILRNPDLRDRLLWLCCDFKVWGTRQVALRRRRRYRVVL
jgi:hypothetical protein